MPRINVEDVWLVDPRREFLADLLGDRDAADGTAFRFWRLAQEYKNGVVPKDMFSRSKRSEEFVKAGLASEVDEGFYVSGAKERHEWVQKKRDSGALGGKASGEAKRSKTKHMLQSASHMVPTAEPSCSSSSSKNKNMRSPSPKAPPDIRITKIKNSFLGAFLDKYGVAPPWTGKEAKLAGRLLTWAQENCGILDPVEFCEGLVSNYLNSQDRYLTDNRHPFPLLATQPQKYVETASSGFRSGPVVYEENA